MKHMINLEAVAGIGVVGKNLMRYYADNNNRDSLHVVSPDGVDIPVNSNNQIYSHIIHSKKEMPLTSSLNGLREFYTPEINSMTKLVENINPDILSCSGTYRYPWVVLNAARKTGIPLVVTYDGVMEKETSDPLLHEMSKEFVDIENFSYIFPSILAKETVEDIHRVKFNKTLISPNGVEKIFFEGNKSETLSTNSKKLNIGFVGRLYEIKNPEYLLTLKDDLNDAGIDSNIFCVTGSSNTYKDDYKANLYKNLLDSGVKFLGPMNAQRLSDFYNSLDLTISPSVFETFGNAPLEATATGTPALVSKNMGVSEVYDSLGLEELVIDFKDPESIISVIQKVKDGSVGIGEGTRQKIKEKYSWDAVLHKREAFRSKR